MARKRMIDPSIWADEDFGSLTPEGQIMFIGMFSNADDEGRLPGNALFLASTIMPYKGLTKSQATTLRDTVLEKMHSIVLYVVDGKEYLQFKKWETYQSINKPTGSKYPPLPEDYGSNTVTLPPNRIEEKRIEENVTEEEKKYASIAYLIGLPPEDLVEFSQKYEASERQIRLKAIELSNYCIGHGKKYKNYRAMLNNALIKDFGMRKIVYTRPSIEPEIPITPEKKAAAEKTLAEMREKFHKTHTV